MLHPIFSVLIRRPDLLAEHVAGYVGLVQEEVTDAGKEVLYKAIAWAVVGVAALIFLILAGVAAMLGGVHGAFHWSLAVVPAIPLVAALVGFGYAKKPLTANRFAVIKSQINADVDALKHAGEQQ
jgi:hypothetical protein